MLREINAGFKKTAVLRVDGVIVLSLSVKNFAESAAVADSFHLAVEFHLRIIFGKHINRIALFKSAEKLNAFRHCAVAYTFRKNMDAFLETLYCIGCMLVEIVSQNNCVEVKLQKLIEAFINRKIFENFIFSASVSDSVVAEFAKGNDFAPFNKAEIFRYAKTSAGTHYAYSDFFHKNTLLAAQFCFRLTKRGLIVKRKKKNFL